MNVLGNGLIAANHPDAVTVKETELSTLRRVGAPEDHILVVQSNLSSTYAKLGRFEESLQLDRDIYYGRLKFFGEEHRNTLHEANNYASSLSQLRYYAKAKALQRRTIPVARRVLGESDVLTFKLRGCYAESLYEDPAATLDDLHESVTTLEDLARTARRVLGGAYPLVGKIEQSLRKARAALRARETQS